MRIRRRSTTDSLEGSSDLENSSRSDNEGTESRQGEFGGIYATEPDGEQAPTSQNADDVIEEIAREVDERRRARRVRNDTDDAEFEISGEDADLGDETPPRRWQRRRLSLANRFPTFSSLATPLTWWQRLKRFVFPPKPDLDELVPHYRITPIISGIVVPFSLLLEIPGLTEHWYIRTNGNKVVESRRNSAILEAGLAVSIFSGLVANIFLVMRFLEVRVKTMTILSVVFLTLHDVINITAVTNFGIEHSHNDGFTYGQAYWMTLCSTIASLLTNFTLIYDLYSTPDFEKSGSGLTQKQRSLLIILIVLMCYLALGALVNSFLIHISFIDALYFSVVTIETIGFGDIYPKSTGGRVFTALYGPLGIVFLYAAVTTTRATVLEAMEIGYRQRMKVVKERRRAAAQRKRVMSRWKKGVAWRLRNLGVPVWVKEESERGRFVSLLHWVEETAKGWLGRSINLVKGKDAYHPHHGMRLNLEALSPQQLEAAAAEAGVPLSELLPPNFKTKRPGTRKSLDSESIRTATDGGRDVGANAKHENHFRREDMPLTHSTLGRMASMLGRFALAVSTNEVPSPPPVVIHHEKVDIHPVTVSTNGVPSPPPVVSHHEKVDIHPATVFTRGVGLGSRSSTISMDHRSNTINSDDRRNGWNLTEAYESYKDHVDQEERKAFYARLTIALSLFLVFWMVGSGVFAKTEGWEFGTAMYFCVVAFTTIGYGDYYPMTPAGRSVFVVWALLGVGTMTIMISIVSEAFETRYESFVRSHIFEKAVKRYKERARSMTDATLSHRTPLAASVLAHYGSGVHDIVRTIPSRVPTPKLPSTPAEVEDGVPERSKFGTHSRRNLTPSQVLLDTQHRTKAHLEGLPHKILHHAKAFHNRIHYFFGPHSEGPTEGMRSQPEWLKKLMDEIAGVDMINEAMKREILNDQDARRTLFTLSIERSLIEMIATAEEALSILAEREHRSNSYHSTVQ